MARELTDAEVFGGRELTDDEVFGRRSIAKPTPRAVKKDPWSAASGFMANVNRGLGIGDELAAGTRTAANLLTGKIGPQNLVDDFKQSMAAQRGTEDGFATDHPRFAALAKGLGNAGTVAVPGGPTTQAFANASRLANMERGAVTAGLTAAGYAAADRGTARERLKAAGAASMDPVVALLGAGGGALAPAMPRALKAKPKSNPLADIGVETSLPQQMGGQAKVVEDTLARFPIAQQAIKGARNRQVEQLNRGIGLKALEPIGETLPKDIKPGFEMVRHIEDKISKVYDDAIQSVPQVTVDDQFAQTLADIAKAKTDLPESSAAQFDNILRDRLTRIDGAPSGKTVKLVHSELGKLQSEFNRRGESTMADMMGGVRDALLGLIKRADPKAGAMIDKADQSWQIYSILNDAAGMATNRGGVFVPGQLNSQVGKAAQRFGSNMKGKGLGPLQDIATEAARQIPDSFGNPGTADALLLGGSGAFAMAHPVGATIAATGIGAASTPYFMMARKVLEELPPTATAEELGQTQKLLQALAAKDPEVAQLYQQVLTRLPKAAGVYGQNGQPPM
jgi:hypothetical protein